MHNRMLKAAIAVVLTASVNLAYANHFVEILRLESLHDAKIINEQQPERLEKISPRAAVRRISGKRR